ncbi:MAG: ribosomal L7Ae/L30e/S12e/Gadd45 family protein [Clostridia bacterium]|nr:ribosomal L7Ae/L30e/S12e/Gadd45 family protein [Clostridia bacterium]
MVNNVKGLLGICSKAGKIIAGTDAVIEGIYEKTVVYVIVAEDASDNTKKKIEKVCKEKNIKMFIYGNIFENSKAIR